jgi:hypothetical protein
VARALSAGLAWDALERATLPCRSGRGGRQIANGGASTARDSSRFAQCSVRPVDAEAVVCADARLPNVEELGLDHAGVRLGDDRRVTVDQQRTSAAGIYTAGDVTGPPWLTNRAVAAGTVAGGNALGGNRTGPRRAPASVGQHPAAACRRGPDRRAGHGRRPARGDPHGRSCVERAGGRSLAIPGGAEAGGRPGHPGDPGRPHGGARVHRSSPRSYSPWRRASATGSCCGPHHLHPSMAKVVGLAIRLDDLARNA